MNERKAECTKNKQKTQPNEEEASDFFAKYMFRRVRRSHRSARLLMDVDHRGSGHVPAVVVAGRRSAEEIVDEAADDREEDERVEQADHGEHVNLEPLHGASHGRDVGDGAVEGGEHPHHALGGRLDAVDHDGGGGNTMRIRRFDGADDGSCEEPIRGRRSRRLFEVTMASEQQRLSAGGDGWQQGGRRQRGALP